MILVILTSTFVNKGFLLSLLSWLHRSKTSNFYNQLCFDLKQCECHVQSIRLPSSKIVINPATFCKPKNTLAFPLQISQGQWMWKELLLLFSSVHLQPWRIKWFWSKSRFLAAFPLSAILLLLSVRLETNFLRSRKTGYSTWSWRIFALFSTISVVIPHQGSSALVYLRSLPSHRAYL